MRRGPVDQAPVAGLGVIALLAPAVPGIVHHADLRLVLLVGAVFVGELLPIRLGPQQGEVAPSTTFTFAILLTFGTPAAVAVQRLASLASDVVQRKRPTAHRLQRRPVRARRERRRARALPPVGAPGPDMGLPQLIAIVAAGSVFFAVNTGAVAIAVSLGTGTRVTDSIAGDLVRQSATESVLIGLAPLAVVALERNVVLLALLGLPLLAVQRRGAPRADERAPRDARSAHRAPEPSDVLQPAPARDRRGGAGQPHCRATGRSRSLQGDQRHARPPVRRRGSAAGGAAAHGRCRPARPGGSSRRRRVRGPAAPAQGGQAPIAVAERLRRSLSAPLDAAGVRLDLGGSVGVATYPADGRDVETLLQHADIAMYEAKSGRTGVESYTRGQDADNLFRLTLAGDLRRALDDGELITHFQPKVDLCVNRVCGAEALVRWQHARRADIPPEVFIPIAEQTGFIVPLTMHVIEDSVRAASAWRRHGADLAVAVNLSARVLLEPTLPATVLGICERYELPPDGLVLEITESMVVADPQRVLPTLTRLAEYGSRSRSTTSGPATRRSST